jgi:hypothetical protein
VLRYTIIQDKQEKLPLVFPKSLVVLPPSSRPQPSSARTVEIEVVKERLDHTHPELHRADYYIRGFPDQVVIERKHDIEEIAQNCLNPRRRKRFIQELEYLHDVCRRPILLAETTPRQLLTKSPHCPAPQVACDALIALLLRYRIELWMMPSTTLNHRKAMGELAARIMIQGVFRA